MNDPEDHDHENMIPPGALKAAGGLIAVSLLLVSAVRVGAVSVGPNAAEARVEAKMHPVRERLLRFEDRNGFVVITDTSSNQQVAQIGAEGSGFIRGVMRGLARERHMHKEGAAAPFRLAAWPDGALTLTDDTTGRVIELGSFGPDNRAAFARLLNERTSS